LISGLILFSKTGKKIERDEIRIEKLDTNAYFGKRFEIVVRNELFPKLFDFDKSGRWWHKDKEIDIVALNEEKKEILFAELKEKSQYVQWNNDKRKERFAIFAKSFKERDVHCFDLKDLKRNLKL